MPWLLYLSFVARIVFCQTTSIAAGTALLSSTSDPNLSKNGNFTYPSGATPWFDQGNSMVIQWESPYTNINLFYIWRGNTSIGLGDRQCLIASGIPGDSKDWVVSCAIPPNCNTEICSDSSTGPFALRAVNTYGSGDDQSLGGFFSDEFYIRPKPSPSSSSTVSSTSSTTTSSSTTSSSSSSAAASSIAASTEAASITSSLTTTSLNLATTEPLSATSQPSPTAAPAVSADSTNSIAIGVGVGAGTAVALLVGAAAFFIWRRCRRRPKQKKVSWPLPAYPESYAAHWDQKPEHYFYNKAAIAATMPVEAPAREPQELPSRISHR